MTKKMGTLGKLSHFSGIKSSSPEEAIAPTPIETPPAIADDTPAVTTEAPTPKKKVKRSSTDKPVTINIKIKKSQKDWLAETASQVRDNNSDPVPPALRVYPQHLIGVAIELLQAADVDWTEIKTVGDLQKALKVLDV
jgi:hypothetical protein